MSQTHIPTFRIIIQKKHLHLLHTPNRTRVQTMLGKVQIEFLWLKERRDILDALTLGCFIRAAPELKGRARLEIGGWEGTD